MLNLIYKIHWKHHLISAALAAGLAGFSPVQAQHIPEYKPPPQLTHQQFEQELAKADAEYAKNGSAQPYKDIHQKLVGSWDMKDEEYAQLIFQIMNRVEIAKRDHPFRNGFWGQIYYGERSLVPRF